MLYGLMVLDSLVLPWHAMAGRFAECEELLAQHLQSGRPDLAEAVRGRHRRRADLAERLAGQER